MSGKGAVSLASFTDCLPSEPGQTWVEGMLAGSPIVTAFQPIYDLRTGFALGAEALARFEPGGPGPDVWFAQAASLGFGADLELAAVKAALKAAEQLPGHLYAAVNVSPETCLDSRLGALIQQSCIPVSRIVLELTEHHPVADYAPLAEALTPMRRAGLRVAVDDTGAGYSSMLHILQLAPEIIKIDKGIIAGIAGDPPRQALGVALAGFAASIGSVLIAEGLETRADLECVTRIGMTAGQGHLLSRPSVKTRQWRQWQPGRRNQLWAAPMPDALPQYSWADSHWDNATIIQTKSADRTGQPSRSETEA